MKVQEACVLSSNLSCLLHALHVDIIVQYVTVKEVINVQEAFKKKNH